MTFLFWFHGSPVDCRASATGTLSAEQCSSLCPPSSGSVAQSCEVGWGEDPQILSCDYHFASPHCIAGRRPAGLESPSHRTARTALGRYLADLAHLEAASVVAFSVLAKELEEHKAPPHLRAASLRAARDETRHAALMKELAERFGARVAPVRVVRGRRRTIEAMAAENAVEGCVGETFGAAVAHIQAKRATDTRIRLVMRGIAADETRHAQLSWELARWFDSELTLAARRRLHEARRIAVSALARSVATVTYGSAASQLGLPTAVEASALVDELNRCLWSAPWSKGDMREVGSIHQMSYGVEAVITTTGPPRTGQGTRLPSRTARRHTRPRSRGATRLDRTRSS